MLASPVGMLQRIRVPRGIAVVGTVLLAFAIIFALGSLIATQLTGWPETFRVINDDRKQDSVGSGRQPAAVRRSSAPPACLQDLGKELDKPKAGTPGEARIPSLVGPSGHEPLHPCRSKCGNPIRARLESLSSLIAPLVSPLATTGIIVIFVIFILIQREDLRNRLIRLAGSHDLQRTTAALDDAAAAQPACS